MKKSSKKALVIWTIVLSLAYVVFLSILSWTTGLPVERELIVVYRQWSIPLPFTISTWWFCLLWPVIGAVFVYLQNEYLIIGDEPSRLNFRLNIKHDTKSFLFVINATLGFILFGSLVIAAILYPTTAETGVGPLSALISVSLIVLIFGGACMGFGVSLIMTLCWGTILDSIYIPGTDPRLEERFDLTFAHFAKMGLKGFFPSLGLTAGYVIRNIFSGRLFRGQDKMYEDI